MLLEPVGRNDEFHVVLKRTAFNDMYTHASTFLHQRREVLGLLIGKEMGSEALVIERTIPLTEGYEASVQLQEQQFEIFEKLQLDEAAGEFVLGWYHSHPFLGLFLSITDIETHCMAFQLRYTKAVAVVIDPALATTGIKTDSLEVFRVKNPQNWPTLDYETVCWSIHEDGQDPTNNRGSSQGKDQQQFSMED